MLQKNNLYIIFFKDLDKTHIFAKIIQWGSKFNYLTNCDPREKAINHVACGYILKDQKCIYESLGHGGTQINNFNRRIYNYQGKIWAYPISDLKITESDIETYINNNLGKKYSVIGAIASYEFTENKWLIFKPINRFLNWLRKHYKSGGVFCSNEIANMIYILCQDKANKNCKIYKEFISKNKLDEITPQDLKKICDIFYNSIQIK